MKSFYTPFPGKLIALTLLLFSALGTVQTQTTLAPGDIVFTQLNMEGTNEDAFAFVLLTSVEPGTVVRITDKEYVSGMGFTEESEGIITITFNQAYPCGTEVLITDSDPANDQYVFAASETGIQVDQNTANSFQLSTAGETMVMFQGDDLVNPCATCFITALANTGVEFGGTATGSGDLPPGLTVGTSAMAMTSGPGGDEWDNIKYNCSTTQADPADLRPAILNPVSWTTDNDAALPVTACGLECSAGCVAPVINSVTVTNCGNGPSGFVVLTVNGELNGAANWQWKGPSVLEEQPCDQQAFLGNGQTININFLVTDLTFYVVATGGCLTEEVCFGYVPSEVLGLPAFGGELPDVCSSDGIQSGLGGATPIGGIYSGMGVTDDGNGMTFSFDPAVAGAGNQTVTYTQSTTGNPCGATTASQTIEVLAAPNVAMTTSALTIAVDAPVQAMLSGGTPTGGTYSGMGVTDNGNGMTYSFNPAVAGAGVTIVTYTFADATNGCSASATGEITVEANAVAGNVCSDATDLSDLFGQAVGAAQTSALFDNRDATTGTSDPSTGFECFGEPLGGGASPSLENTLWYTFTGDGETYTIRSVECSATDYIEFGDTQFAIYTGNCIDFTSIACNEDAPDTDPNGPYPAEITLATETGVVYLMLIDGFNGSEGEFCLEVTRSTDVAVTDISRTNIKVFPNPTSTQINVSGIDAYQIDVYDHVGRLVTTQTTTTNAVDMTALPSGVYLLKLHTEQEVYSAKVVKE